MDSDFFKFPHTPHLAWLGEMVPRDDKIMSPAEVADMLAHPIIVEEKIDGANVGVSVDAAGEPRVQNRGAYLGHRAHPQFEPLWAWLAERRSVLGQGLGSHLILFGEWCFAVHSVAYRSLPDWFLGFDVLDRRTGRFWSVARRDQFLADLGICVVPRLGAGKFASKRKVVSLLGRSRYADGPMEGIYLRQDNGQWLERRSKVVARDFTEGIGEHWMSSALVRNRIANPAAEANDE